MIAYIDDDEWYPWYSISTMKGYLDMELEIEESEYKELLDMQMKAHEFQERLKELYLRGKKHD